MASVYMALDENLHRHVALKVMHEHMQGKQQLRDRFHHEARSVSKLKHPNVLEIYDYSGTEAQELWLVMEYIEGYDLHEYTSCFPDFKLHPIVATSIIREVAKALFQAHSHGIVHRDVKPSNIMVSYAGTIKLMDFGIAKDLVRDHELTQTGSFIGSPSYMPPEQVRGEELGTTVDIYALSVLFFQLLVGRLPYTGSSTHKIMEKVLTAPVPKVKEYAAGMPSFLNDFIATGMAKKHTDRHRTVKYMVDALDGFLRGYGFGDSGVELELFFAQPQEFVKKVEKNLRSFAAGISPHVARPKQVQRKISWVRSAGGRPTDVREVKKSDTAVSGKKAGPEAEETVSRKKTQQSQKNNKLSSPASTSSISKSKKPARGDDGAPRKSPQEKKRGAARKVSEKASAAVRSRLEVKKKQVMQKEAVAAASVRSSKKPVLRAQGQNAPKVVVQKGQKKPTLLAASSRGRSQQYQQPGAKGPWGGKAQGVPSGGAPSWRLRAMKRRSGQVPRLSDHHAPPLRNRQQTYSYWQPKTEQGSVLGMLVVCVCLGTLGYMAYTSTPQAIKSFLAMKAYEDISDHSSQKYVPYDEDTEKEQMMLRQSQSAQQSGRTSIGPKSSVGAKNKRAQSAASSSPVSQSSTSVPSTLSSPSRREQTRQGSQGRVVPSEKKKTSAAKRGLASISPNTRSHSHSSQRSRTAVTGQQGSVYAFVTPTAQIYLGKRFLGLSSQVFKSPLVLYRGSYRLTFQKSGYYPVVRNFTVQKHHTLNLGRIALRKITYHSLAVQGPKGTRFSVKGVNKNYSKSLVLNSRQYHLRLRKGHYQIVAQRGGKTLRRYVKLPSLYGNMTVNLDF